MIFPDASCNHKEEWKKELKSLGDYDGVVSEYPANWPLLFVTLILRKYSHIKTIGIGIQFWSICCRMSDLYEVDSIKIRIGVTKADISDALSPKLFDERICEFHGPPHSEPNGHFSWNRMRSKIGFMEGNLPKANQSEQVTKNADAFSHIPSTFDERK